MVYRLKNKKRFFTFISLLIIVVILFIGTVSSTGKNAIQENQFITVRQGDTLWKIASSHRGSIEIRHYIYKLKEVNNLNDAIIYAGQKLELP
ncbi:MAG TPA: LysM peptidoglycan-binding domain-containing protein [Thermoclostridium sp.]|nr:LysM peptidoglycan-binding domain-containing protein [Thermoclostridium sp.]